MKFNPYLNFNGNSEEAFNFYKSVFGGEFTGIYRFKDTPEGDKLSDSDKEKIMHIALPIGEGNLLMATDALESMGHPLVEGNNFYIMIDTSSEAESDTVFNKLAEGGTIEVPLQKMFWGSYYGSLKDKFGVRWMFNYTYPEHKE